MEKGENMRKSFLIKKRVLALALAFSMTVSQAAFAAPVEAEIEESTDEIAVQEVEAQEVISEETATNEAGLEEMTTEEVATQEAGAATDETEEVENEAAGQETEAQKPGKVVNVGFFEYLQTGVIMPYHLSWDAVQAADKYQIRIFDAKGYEYADGYNNSGLKYRSTSNRYYDLRNIHRMYAYQAKGTSFEMVRDEQDKSITAEAGTYSIQVRAVNTITVDGKQKTAYGDWSDTVSYTIPEQEKVQNITDLRLCKKENGEQYISYANTGYCEMEIKDANGREYFNSGVSSLTNPAYLNYYSEWIFGKDTGDVYAYEKNANGGYKIIQDAQGNRVTGFSVGQTYTVRLRMSSGNEQSDWSAPLTFTLAENKLPEKTGMLEYDEEENTVSWNPSQNASGYEVEIKDASGNIYGNIYSKDSKTGKYVANAGFESSKTSLYIDSYPLCVLNQDATNWYFKTDAKGNMIYAGEFGQTYTVRVRAYNFKKEADSDTNTRVKQYSDWSEACTCAVPKRVPIIDSLAKVTGLVAIQDADDSYVKWDELEKTQGLENIRYEVEIKDAAGRAYTSGTAEGDVLKNQVTYNNYISGVTTYVKVDGEYVSAKNSDGKAIKAFSSGETYTVRVRALAKAYNETTERYDQEQTGAWSDAYTFTVANDSIATGINAKPATVTGLWVKTEPFEDKTLSSPIVYWNKIDNVAKYEIEIKDAAGNSFISSYSLVNNQLVPSYKSTTNNSVSIRDLSGLTAYSKTSGYAVSTLRDQAGNIIYPFQSGQKYTLRVRAINEYTSKNADGTWNPKVQYVGDWSAPYDYVALATNLAITGLRLIKTDKDYYYFDYTADTKNGSTVYYQIAKDNSFNAASLVRNWNRVSFKAIDGISYKFVIAKDSEDLEPSTTYYVRMINTKDGTPYANQDATLYNKIMSTAAVTSFTTAAKQVKTPKNITGLKLYVEEAASFKFRFDSILDEENDDRYELQIANNPNSANWASMGETLSLSKEKLAEGTTYVRAVAYVRRYNEVRKEYEKIYGVPSNVVAVTMNTVNTSSIGSISLAEETRDGYTFKYTGTIKKHEKVEVLYSTSKSFSTNAVKSLVNTTVTTTNVNNIWTLPKSDLIPGRTYYVKMRVKNPNAITTQTQYSAYSNVVSVKAAMPAISVTNSKVTKNSIAFYMSNLNEYNAWLTGYEVQKKVVKGKKTSWETVQKSALAQYEQKKLKADTVYTYRVRPYYFNKDTNKTTNGSWVYFEAMTGWSGSLKAEAKAASKTSIKLTWKKVSSAKGYEIYRKVAVSDGDTKSNGRYNGYVSEKLIASLGASKTSYTDKKLTSGMTYNYSIKAYKTVGGKKVYIEDYAGATLDFVLDEIKSYRKSNGTVVVCWNPVYSAKGYLVEKQNPVTGKWSKYKTIKKVSTSSITLPKSKNWETGDTYRIRAYNGKKYTRAITQTVYPILATPTKVTAKATKNGIKVSWKKVTGADYYKVYRTTSNEGIYNADKKTYSYSTGSLCTAYVADPAAYNGYRKKLPEEWNATTYTDEKLTYTRNGIANQTFYAGPDSGVKYYYYVVACKKSAEYSPYVKENGQYGTDIESGESKAASATFKETKPAKTSITKATSKSKKVTLTYKASKNADGYEVQRSTSKKKGFKVIKNVTKPTTLTFTDKYNKKSNPIKKGKTYYYRVRAYRYNDDGSKVYASFSTVKAVKVK